MWKEIIINGIPSGYLVNEIGDVKNSKGKLLSFQLDERGYHSISLKGKKFKIHRLVALAFIPNPRNKREVNHIDGNKDNNCVSNLEWVTSSENMLHAYKTGLHPIMYGENHAESRYTEEQVHHVCQLIEQGKSRKEIKELTGVSTATIKDISNGRAWVRVSRQYDLSKSAKRKYRKFYFYIDNAIRCGVSCADIFRCISMHFKDINPKAIQSLIYHRRASVAKEDRKYLSVTFL